MSDKPTLISAATVSRLKDGSVLSVRVPYLVTPSAAELAEKKRIRIQAVTEPMAVDGQPGHANTSDEAPQAGPLAARVESTLLAADATPEQVRALCAEAVTLGCHGICVNPIHVPVAVEALAGSELAVVTVCGFPLGANTRCTKSAEARTAQSQGAREIDMVLALGLLKAGDYASVRDDIRAVRDALPDPQTVLKVIIEAPLLTHEEMVAASVISVEAGAQFVKTGTGSSGPATAQDVALIRRTVGHRARIKAAGGIRDRATAGALIAAGADRIGTSRAAQILS